ncbi:unnamed protein product [Urochloa humidicola]
MSARGAIARRLGGHGGGAAEAAGKVASPGVFHTQAPPTAPPGPWPSPLRPRKLKEAFLAPLSRKDEELRIGRCSS